ncbi:hypothetical protein RRG08_057981 [Elysia crispata]|uniref:Uncharacterized protein n=1 Tax=Elysia crispata TaxID=231223 RepID=A0AAE1DY84_9GAST|nr:hypothetical protein RRG08_057981 [Elysia crispata]
MGVGKQQELSISSGNTRANTAGVARLRQDYYRELQDYCCTCVVGSVDLVQHNKGKSLRVARARE